MIALLVEAFPEIPLDNSKDFIDYLLTLVISLVVFLAIFIFIERLHANTTYKKQYVLEVIQKVRKYREQGGSEYNVNVKSEETGELLSYHIKFLND